MSEKTRCVSVGEISYERSERIDSPSTSEIKRFVGLEHFDQGNLEIVRFGSCVDLGSTMKKCVSGDTLIARRNVYLKRASRCNYDALCSGDAIVLRENECVVPGFLSILFNSDSFWKFASSNADGTMSKRLSVSHLKSYEFRLPSVENQKKFVDLIWKLENLKTKLVMELENLNLLIKSRFIEMFGHQDQNEKGFKVSTIGESCIIRDSERIPVTSSEREPGPYPYYGANGLQDYVNDYIFDGDFVLMAEDGGFFDDPERPIAYAVSGKCWVNNHAHILEPGKEMNVQYLEWALKYRDITRVINGTTRFKLTQAAMRSISLLIPPLELQDEFASFLKQVDKSKLFIEWLGFVQIYSIEGCIFVILICQVITCLFA